MAAEAPEQPAESGTLTRADFPADCPEDWMWAVYRNQTVGKTPVTVEVRRDFDPPARAAGRSTPSTPLGRINTSADPQDIRKAAVELWRRHRFLDTVIGVY
jgi:hypothetical protein